jgi:hypothetical protein
MANGHGGARPGSGRPRKPLAEKILEGHPGKRKPKVLGIVADNDTPVPEYPERLAYYPTKVSGLPTSQDIFHETVEFLKTTGCLHLINPAFIEEYALLKARFFEAERTISKTMLAYETKDEKKTTKMIEANPAVDISLKYLRAADQVWAKIWDVVRQNSETLYGSTPNDDLMRGLLQFNREG